jgi:hypothetical protein
LLPSFDPGLAFTLPVNQFRTKKEYCFRTVAAAGSARVEYAMSVEQTDVVDIVSIERETGNVILTISDHLDWSDSVAHQRILQKKLNTYLAFVQSGEILEQYPKAKDRPVVLNVVFRFPPDELGQAFITRVRAVIESAGFTLCDEVFTGGHFN